MNYKVITAVLLSTLLITGCGGKDKAAESASSSSSSSSAIEITDDSDTSGGIDISDDSDSASSSDSSLSSSSSSGMSEEESAVASAMDETQTINISGFDYAVPASWETSTDSSGGYTCKAPSGALLTIYTADYLGDRFQQQYDFTNQMIDGYGKEHQNFTRGELSKYTSGEFVYLVADFTYENPGTKGNVAVLPDKTSDTTLVIMMRSAENDTANYADVFYQVLDSTVPTETKIIPPPEEPATAASDKDFDGSRYSDYGPGLFGLRNQSGATLDGQQVIVEPNGAFAMQLGYESLEINGSYTSFIYIDGLKNSEVQLGDSEGNLNLTGSDLSSGEHLVEMVQYMNNDPTMDVTTYKSAKYTVRQDA